MKKFAVFGLTVAMGAAALMGMGACGGDGPANVNDPDDGDKTLKIGITLYSPMNYYDENDKLVGFDTEFAELACAKLGYTPKFIEIDWNNKINELKTKKIDLIWNGMTISDELKASIAISDPYMENKQVIVAKKDDLAKFSDIASLSAAASIAAEEGSAGQTVAEENGYESKLQTLSAQSDCLLEVKAGRSEIAILDLTMARSMTGEGTDFADLGYLDVGFAGEEYGIGMRKEDTDLLASLNSIIAEYKTDGTFDALIAKYMV